VPFPSSLVLVRMISTTFVAGFTSAMHLLGHKQLSRRYTMRAAAAQYTYFLFCAQRKTAHGGEEKLVDAAILASPRRRLQLGQHYCHCCGANRIVQRSIDTIWWAGQSGALNGEQLKSHLRAVVDRRSDDLSGKSLLCSAEVGKAYRVVRAVWRHRISVSPDSDTGLTEGRLH
jgi:hypothetical protein